MAGKEEQDIPSFPAERKMCQLLQTITVISMVYFRRQVPSISLIRCKKSKKNDGPQMSADTYNLGTTCQALKHIK